MNRSVLAVTAMAIAMPLLAQPPAGQPGGSAELQVAPKQIDQVLVEIDNSRQDETVTAISVIGASPRGRAVNDPLSQSYGSWGQDYQDQWGLYALNLVSMHRGMVAPEYGSGYPLRLEPVVVAVIDTGVDYTHPDLPPSQLWRNPGERSNGRDDDGNGLIDDLIGWNFINDTNAPWDDHGHGTLVAGIIAADTNNSIGIAGVAPNAQLMVLKALDGSGHGNGSDIARAIRYAVDKGVRIIHLSLGGQVPGAAEQDALAYAQQREVLVVTAAGNQASGDANGYESLDGVLVVGSLGPDGQRAEFSNWGADLDLLAPGVEILSLRARGSDFLRRNGSKDYQPEAAVVDREYYRATGNSFAAPYVTGLAALLLGRDPWMEPRNLNHMLTQSARDLGPEGSDSNHGYGAVDAMQALASDPQRYINAQLTGAVLNDDRTLSLNGSADADLFAQAYLQFGQGEQPSQWHPLGKPMSQGMVESTLYRFDPSTLPGGLVTVRLTVEHLDGGLRHSRLQLQLPQSAAK
ncbi:MAG: S8 family serine peptidase [Motiliproteus sp.]|nr:S8 family serine peptidase [Motiliproteus sp.]MCW9051706.1 S8 family serine peptidase [Motiliproteus sp.]